MVCAEDGELNTATLFGLTRAAFIISFISVLLIFILLILFVFLLILVLV